MGTGVLVFDLDRWRREGLTAKLERWVRRVSGVMVARLALNLEFHNQFDVIDWRWNVMGLMMVPPQRCMDRGRIFHWAEAMKPWSEHVPQLSKHLQSIYRELFDPFKPVRPCMW